MQPPPDILLFFGRLHPLLVHLPIGMLVALATLEAAAWFPRFKNANAGAGFLLALAAPLAVITAICGLLLSLAGGYDETLLSWHKWLGLATAAGSVIAGVLYWRGMKNSYRMVLFLSMAMLMAAGHLGGSLTHGSDYLSRYAPAPLKRLLGGGPGTPSFAGKKLAELPVFAAIVAPVLQSKCVDCHNAAKAKAGLRFDSFANLMKGSENGAVVVPHDAANSPMLQRVQLPADSEDHMPPSGKTPLTADEISLLQWWIDAGAPEKATVSELQPSPEMLKTLAAVSGRPASDD